MTKKLNLKIEKTVSNGKSDLWFHSKQLHNDNYDRIILYLKLSRFEMYERFSMNDKYEKKSTLLSAIINSAIVLKMTDWI